jgi:hypothetical protein
MLLAAGMDGPSSSTSSDETPESSEVDAFSLDPPLALRALLRASPSAAANHNRLRTMMKRLGLIDVRDLYRRRPTKKGSTSSSTSSTSSSSTSSGTLSAYAVAAWIEDGTLPSGGKDPYYRLNSAASRKNMYSTLVMLSDASKCCGAFAATVPGDARDAFRARLKELADEVASGVRRNQLSEREAKTILPWECIAEKYAAGRDDLAEADDRLLVDFWLMDPMEFPPKRLDVGACRVVRSVSRTLGRPHVPKEAAEPGWARQDFLLVREAGRGPSPTPAFSELHLRSYKTSKTYSEFVQVLPQALTDAIVANLNAESRGSARGPARLWRPYLFQTRKGTPGPMTENALGQQLRTAMGRLTGVPIGASNLRKAFISHLLNVPDLSRERLAEVARRMMHSEDTQRDYRRVDIRASLAALVTRKYLDAGKTPACLSPSAAKKAPGVDPLGGSDEHGAQSGGSSGVSSGGSSGVPSGMGCASSCASRLADRRAGVLALLMFALDVAGLGGLVALV